MDSKTLLHNECKHNLSISIVSEPIRSNLNKPKKIPWLMYFTAITANLLLISTGMNLVWMSPVLPKLQSNDTNINPLESPITVTQTSILATFAQIGVPIGLILSAYITDILGRKRTLMIEAIFFIFLSAIMAIANNIYVYYICNFILGICMVCSYVTVTIFNNEIAEDKNRGIIGCIMGLSMPLGQLLVYIFGPILSVKVFTVSCSIPSLFYLILFFIIPESPVFLAIKGKKLESMKTLEKLRRSNDIEEYNKIEKSILATNDLKKERLFDLFKNPVARKALAISIGITIVQQLSGIFVILTFLGSIFSNARSVSGNTFGIVFGSVQLIIIFIATFFVDNLGRKPLLLISSTICAVALFFIGFYFYLQQKNSVWLDSIGWLPVLFIVIYITGYGFGLGPLPVILEAELFPNNLRAAAIAVILMIEDALVFLIKFSFPFISVYVGIDYCMWFFSGCCLLGFVWIYVVVPETKGKSFLEIQEIIKK